MEVQSFDLNEVQKSFDIMFVFYLMTYETAVLMLMLRSVQVRLAGNFYAVYFVLISLTSKFM